MDDATKYVFREVREGDVSAIALLLRETGYSLLKMNTDLYL